MKPLEQVIADAREEAAVLDANRAGFAVARVRELLEEIASSAEEFITWLSEGDAAMRAGVKPITMAGRFPAMQRDGNARLSGRARQYRQCAVPQRAQTVAVAARAKALAQRDRVAS